MLPLKLGISIFGALHYRITVIKHIERKDKTLHLNKKKYNYIENIEKYYQKLHSRRCTDMNRLY